MPCASTNRIATQRRIRERKKLLTIAEAFAKYGVEQATLSSSSPRHKALSQANKMLEKLAKYSSVTELNSETSNQNWWSSKPSGGKRRITCRYDSKVFPDLSLWCDDTIEQVKNNVETLKKIIQEIDDSEWAREEERRANAIKNSVPR